VFVVAENESVLVRAAKKIQQKKKQKLKNKSSNLRGQQTKSRIRID